MTSTRSWIAATLTAALLSFGWASTGFAQDKPKDEGLERLLEKLDEKEKDKDKAEPAKEPEKDKAEPAKEPEKDKAEPAKTPARDSADKTKKPGDVAPKDESLDKLLEGLGQTKDTPSPDDKKSGAGGSEDPMPPMPGEPKPDSLKDADKELDKELEKITGKKEKPKNQRDRKGEEEGGPLGQVIKEMRDVQERLGQPDTGEETRKKQGEIVKNLEQLIEQMKDAPSQSQGLKMIREGKKPGEQPGNQPGSQPGAMAQGPPSTKPEKPKQPPIPIELDKAIWGQLPSQFRDEVDNVSSERPLPTRRDLIRLYYMSLSNKNPGREE